MSYGPANRAALTPTHGPAVKNPIFAALWAAVAPANESPYRTALPSTDGTAFDYADKTALRATLSSTDGTTLKPALAAAHRTALEAALWAALWSTLAPADK